MQIPPTARPKTSTTSIFIFVFWIAKIKWRQWWGQILHRMATLDSLRLPPMDRQRLESVGTPGVLSSRRFGLNRRAWNGWHDRRSLSFLCQLPPSSVLDRHHLENDVMSASLSVVHRNRKPALAALVTGDSLRVWWSSMIMTTSKQHTRRFHEWMWGAP